METGATEQMISMSLRASEQVAKLTAWGAERLAVILCLLVKGGYNKACENTAKSILNNDVPPHLFTIKQDDFEAFKQKAHEYGIKFIKFKDKDSACVEIVTRAKYAPYVNRIFEKLGYAPEHIYGAPDQPNNPEQPSKNEPTLVMDDKTVDDSPLNKESNEQGRSSSPNNHPHPRKESITKKVEKIKKDLKKAKPSKSKGLGR